MCLSGLFSCLNLGLMSFDPTNYEKWYQKPKTLCKDHLQSLSLWQLLVM